MLTKAIDLQVATSAGTAITPQEIRILGISGSLRSGSFNTAALHAAAELLPIGVTLEIFDLLGIPLFNQDDEHTPPPRVAELKRRVRSADAILIATPEHNYSIPAALKNCLDWGSRPYGDNAWSGKVAAILGAAPGGVGTARAQYHLRQMFVYLNVFAINQPEVMIMDASHRFDQSGRLVDDATREYIRLQVQSLIAMTKRLVNDEHGSSAGK